MKKSLVNISVLISILFVFLLSSCTTPPQSHVVTIKNMQFTPSEVTVNKGDTVIWVNEGIVAHNVTDTINNIASDEITVGSSWKIVPDKGFSYYCSIHPTMTGEIKVQK